MKRSLNLLHRSYTPVWVTRGRGVKSRARTRMGGELNGNQRTVAPPIPGCGLSGKLATLTGRFAESTSPECSLRRINTSSPPDNYFSETRFSGFGVHPPLINRLQRETPV